MIKRMEELDKLLATIDFNKLWDNLIKTKYAIFNDKNFLLNENEGLELEVTKDDFCYVGNVDKRFNGNTTITINNHCVAILDEETLSDMDSPKIVSLILHEMFHCFQKASGESRFPNELIGIDYPISIENINLRLLERKYLLDTIVETEGQKKLELLGSFFNIRKKRELLIGNLIDYEKAIETIEGPAVYIEYKSLEQLGSSVTINEFIKGINDIAEDILNIRSSTYIQGLLLCIIADEYLVDWKRKLSSSELYLSDFIRDELNINEIEVEDNYENLPAIKQYVANWKKQRDLVFDEFARNTKINIINEDVKITSFDPMNIIKRNHEVIHTRFLGVKTGDNERTLKGPVKTIIGDHILDVKRIEW